MNVVLSRVTTLGRLDMESSVGLPTLMLVFSFKWSWGNQLVRMEIVRFCVKTVVRVVSGNINEITYFISELIEKQVML